MQQVGLSATWGGALLDWRLAVHPGELLLEDTADVHTPALQRGRQETIGHAEHLRMQVQILHLETEGET